MMMDVDAKFDVDDVWDDALFNIDDEPDSPAGVADFDVEKCELKPPTNIPLLPCAPSRTAATDRLRPPATKRR